jgi:hypothetical protein
MFHCSMSGGGSTCSIATFLETGLALELLEGFGAADLEDHRRVAWGY